jgi:hypothetical protein
MDLTSVATHRWRRLLLPSLSLALLAASMSMAADSAMASSLRPPEPHFAASLSTRHPQQFSTVSATCRVIGRNGRPLAGVVVQFTWVVGGHAFAVARVTGDDGTAGTRRAIGAAPVGILATVRVSAAIGGQSMARRLTFVPIAEQAVVLAQDDGLLLTGKRSALRGRPAPDLDDLSESSAARAGRLPSQKVYFRGAACPGSTTFRSPVTLTFTLPKALFAGSRLPLFRYNGHAWHPVALPAVVGAVNTTASVTLARPGRYALFLSTKWREVVQDGYDLVAYSGSIPHTELVDPTVVAAGAVDDPAVVDAVMQVTGSSQATAQGTLRSFTSTTGVPVTVCVLTHATDVVRNWSGASTIGRWFAPYDGGSLPSPSTAQRIYALPDNNTAVNSTLHLLKPGVSLVGGICSDMTAIPDFWPWSTGGGPQWFGPKVSTYPPPAYDAGETVIVSELRWERSALSQVQW